MRKSRSIRFLMVATLVLAIGGASVARAQLIDAGPWSGALASDAVTVVARLNTPRFATLEVSTDAYFGQFASFGEVSSRRGQQPEMSRFRAVGLKPGTRYYYRIRAGDQRDTSRAASFTTLPLEGQPASFKFAVSSGATLGSEHAVFSEIKSLNPLFFLIAGNLYDGALATFDKADFRAAYDATLRSYTQGDLYRTIPVTYVWGVRDFPPDDAPAQSWTAAHETYREYVPHYALTEASAQESPIYQAFTVGRVRFLLLDVCGGHEESGRASLLGERQLAWLKRELLQARDLHPLVFVVTPAAWHSPATGNRDDWSQHAAERDALADWMKENRIANTCFISGDGAGLAYDDGGSNRYGTSQGPGTPVIQAGQLDRAISVGTGPWARGPIIAEPNEGFFGLIEVTDSEESVSVTFRGLNQNGEEKLRFAFRAPAP